MLGLGVLVQGGGAGEEMCHGLEGLAGRLLGVLDRGSGREIVFLDDHGIGIGIV
jgi:hypothetical protein